MKKQDDIALVARATARARATKSGHDMLRQQKVSNQFFSLVKYSIDENKYFKSKTFCALEISATLLSRATPQPTKYS